jgi:4-hydroxy-3-methylbut-2-enyl diphosphate reductase
MIVQVQERYAGYCQGVANAIRVAEDTVNERNEQRPGKTVWLSGQLVHNRVVNDRFLSMGGVAYYDPNVKVYPQDYLVIQAHGATKDIVDKCRDSGLDIRDGTCERVKRMRDEAENHCKQFGKMVVIAGKIKQRDAEGSPIRYHPEIEGLVSYLVTDDDSAGKYAVVQTLEDTANLIESGGIIDDQGITLVGQTTFNEELFYQIHDMLAQEYGQVNRIDSICRNMKMCQTFARSLSQRASMMIVIGGKNSSNTEELAQVCRRTMADKLSTRMDPRHRERVYKIEMTDELQREWFRGYRAKNVIGITAGLSTPPESIADVVRQIKEWYPKTAIRPEKWVPK